MIEKQSIYYSKSIDINMNNKSKTISSSKKSSTTIPRLPKSRSCYICGRQYMIHSFPIHETQCREMFEKWEAQKPIKDRRKCPIDPMKGITLNPNMSMKELDEVNASSYKAWNEQALVKCQNCSRTFLPTQLLIHQRSCKSDNPAKEVGYNNKNNYISSSYQSNDYTDIGNININSGNLIQCQNCGRKFNPPSYVKHAKVCVKVFSQKRKTFDSAKHRAMGTDLEEYINYKTTKNKYTKNNNNIYTNNMKNKSINSTTIVDKITSDQNNIDIPKWKLDSMRFRQAMKEARIVSKAEKQSKETGIPLHLLLPPPTKSSTVNGNNNNNHNNHIDCLYCPTCGRSFNQKAGERHIPQCKNIINKPKVLLSGSGLPSYSTLNKVDINQPSRMNSNTLDNFSNTRNNNSTKNDRIRRNSFGTTNMNTSNRLNTSNHDLYQSNHRSSSTASSSAVISRRDVRKTSTDSSTLRTSKLDTFDDMRALSNTHHSNHRSNNITNSINNSIEYHNKSNNVRTGGTTGLQIPSKPSNKYELQLSNHTSPDNPLALRRFK